MNVRAMAMVICGAAVVAVGAPIAGQRGPAPDPLVREGVTQKLSAHVHVIPDGNVALVPNVGIIVGTRATLVIDPGLGRRNGETVAREVAKVSRNAEVYVASTHYHVEHTTGAAAFPAATYVASSIQVEDYAAAGAQQVQSFSGRSPLTAELLAGASVPVAAVTFDRSHVLDLGGVRVRLLVVGPTHTRGDTAFFVEGDNVLFSGDVVMNESFLAANQASSVRAWLAAFDTLEALRPAVVVPAHGAVGDHTLIARNREVMQEIQRRAVELKNAGRTVEEVATMIQQEQQAKHPGWPRANGIAAAARSAYTEANR